MIYVGLIVVYLGVLINTIILWKCYSKIDLKLRIKNKIFNILIIFVFSILLFCIDLYVPMKFKIFIIYPLLSTMFIVLYKDKPINVCDYLISVPMMLLPLNNFAETWSIFILKGIFTSLISFMLLFLFKINKLLLILKKITITFESKINYFLFGILVVSFLGLYIIFYYNAFNKKFDSFGSLYY